MNFWLLIASGTVFAMVLMAIVWTQARRLNNAGIVDIWWALGFAPVALLYAMLGSGDPVHRITIAILVCLWSIRLGSHLYHRVMGHHPNEDSRYAALREQFPKNTWLMFFGFFELQAVLIGVLSSSFAIVCVNPSPGLHLFEFAGIFLWAVAILGEALADNQLLAFRSDPANKGKVCDTGLWRYSRHPNYFFEWLIWVAFFVFALGSPWGFVAIIGPAIMFYFLTKVTGIPPAEAQSLLSRGDGYRAYQQTTNAFFPGPQKR